MATLPYSPTSRLLSGIIPSYAGGGIAISDTGQRVAESSPLTRTSPILTTNNGAASIWDLVSGTWTEIAGLSPTDQQTAFGRFGWNIAISGDGSTAAVTAPTDGAATNGAATGHSVGVWGSAFVFYRDPGTGAWAQQGSRFGPVATSSDFGEYGHGVALSYDGDTMAVGQTLVLSGTPSGGIHIYVRDTLGAWTEQLFITDDSSPGIGCPVAFADSDTLIVGYPGAQTVHVWTRSAGVWTDSATLSPPAGTYVAFGLNVAVSRNGLVCVVGQENPNSLFDHDPGTFVYTRATTADPFVYASTLTLPTWGPTLSSAWNVLAVSDDRTIVVGPSAISFDGGVGIPDGGGAVVFYYDSGIADWTAYTDASPGSPLIPSDAGTQSDFGCSVAITPSANRFVVGGLEWDFSNRTGAYWAYTLNSVTTVSLDGIAL